MKAQIFGLRVASSIFGLASLAQLTRLILRPEILVAGHHLPLWPSAIACPALAILCLWLWGLSRSPNPQSDLGR